MKTIHKRQLYALGEPLGECVTRREAGRIVCGGGGGGGSSSSTSDSPTTTNTDRRAALQDAVQTGDGSSTGTINITSNSADADVLKTLAESMPDAVKALSSAGADVIKRAGASVVDMNRDSIAANTKSFDSVVNFGAQAIDKLIDASVKTTETGTALASQAVQSFQPTENSNADAMKWGLIAAAAVAAAVVLRGTSK
jgi:hypothetical protein